MPILTLIRHASTPWNEEKKIQGHTDISISKRGRSMLKTWNLPQSIRTARWYSSPLKRSLQTAAALGIQAETEERLIEMSWGTWEGERIQDLREIFGQEMKQNESLGLDFCPPEGESPYMVQKRIKPWLGVIGKLEYPIAAVTHRGVIRAITALATGWNMTGKESHKMSPGTGRQFNISRSGQLELLHPDISFVS